MLSQKKIADNPTLNLIKFADKPSEKEVYHEIGHALEAKLFNAAEVKELKKKYVEGLTYANTTIQVYKTSGGIDKEIILLESDKFLEEYQGRMYVDSLELVFDKYGNVRIDYMDEFLSVPIASYLEHPDELKKKDKVMYDFIERNFKWSL